MSIPKNTALNLFYLLCGYVLLQFSWWTYLLVDLNFELITLQTHGEQQSIESLFQQKATMIFGEAAVFLALLILGAVFVLRSFKKQQQLYKTQQNFLMAVSHELQTPLASVKLILQTVQKEEILQEKKEGLYKTAISETDRLSQLAKQILLATHLDSETYTLEKQHINLSEVVLKIAKKSQHHYNHIETQVTPNISLNGDQLALESIIQNLIDNAIKYGNNAAINVHLIKTEGFIRLSIIDNGFGINDTEKPHIFDRFYRSGNELIRKVKGTGLGLYIVKQLVQLHNGSIEVKDNQPKGSIFVIKFKVD